MIFKLQKIKTRRKFLKEGRGKKKNSILYTLDSSSETMEARKNLGVTF